MNAVVNKLKFYLEHIEGVCADIDGVMVLPEYRGNGLQKILIEHIERRAKELNADYIIAEVTNGNIYSLHNLKELGYKIKGKYFKNNQIERSILLKELVKEKQL